MPDGASEIHHEVELGLVIGTDGRNIPESAALSHIGGYVLALDMTDRILQMKLKSTGLPWALAKGFDTSCPVSDFIVKDKIPDPQEVDLWLKVNGKMRQEGNTKNMIFSIAFLVSWLSRHFTLERGDVILTGTPFGWGTKCSRKLLHIYKEHKTNEYIHSTVASLVGSREPIR
ncbi:hypothetical protein NP493_3385g00006 [Ridgeia piscesae]|uniref:oxaloacetate tautomerase n=1 Tax=Ridgeia piscesae TaxID=27915 RepID=A0AAD9J899_RIDPI|nr:hypothetical protein NP493_3385g00006 [Ridgeia piscesae]